uniref:Sulfotransferase n=1 Tax=Chelonoidis abingdonii TaxID=106734 RepID=A0A8C0GIC6_CHEAB
SMHLSCWGLGARTPGFSPRLWEGSGGWWVVSGPLTLSSLGTNWMLEILSLIRSDGDPGWVRSVLNWDRAPWVENGPGLEAALKYPPPRLLCSHLPIQLFPKSLQRSKAKIIYTLRCPKDVVVSLYHFSKLLRVFRDPGSLDSFLEDFLSGNVMYGSWFDHVTGWMRLKGNENFFSITYQELQQVGKPPPWWLAGGGGCVVVLGFFAVWEESGSSGERVGGREILGLSSLGGKWG